MSKKEKRKLKIDFIGKNAYDVTGSSVLVETDNHNILIEYGLHQGNSVLKEYKINVQKPKGLTIKKIDYIFIKKRNLPNIFHPEAFAQRPVTSFNNHQNHQFTPEKI